MKPLILTLLFGLVVPHVYGQFYIKVAGGYSFAVPGHPIGTNESDVDRLVTDPETGYYVPGLIESRAKEVRGSYNSGIAPMATVGYQFQSNIGIELGAGYVFGKEYVTHDDFSEFLDGELQRQRSTVRTTDAKNLFISPGIVVTTSTPQLRPFVSVGMIMAFPKTRESVAFNSTYDVDYGTTLQEYEYSGGTAIGLRGGAGLDYKLNDKLSLFAELVFTSMNYRPKQREAVVYRVNDADMLLSLSQSARLVRYDNERLTRVGENHYFQSEIGPTLAFSALTTAAGIKFHW